MRGIIGVLVCLGLSGIASGVGLSIDVGDYYLEAGLPGQTISISVVGGIPVYNTNVHAQIADGGHWQGGTIDGPAITNVELLGVGSIFGPNNNGRASGTTNGVISPQNAYEGTATSSGTVLADGLLVELTIDTTGYSVGTWDLLLTGTLSGDTDFGDVPVSITNGTITLPVPEPATLCMLVLGAAGVLRRRRQRTR